MTDLMLMYVDDNGCYFSGPRLTLMQVSHCFTGDSELLDNVESADLAIVADHKAYWLHLTAGGFNTKFMVEAKALTVAPPFGGSFCGAMFGVYSMGNREPVLDPADFSDISIEEKRGS